jgi:hypothetical protein
LKKETQHLTNLLAEYPNPKITFSLGKSFQGIGSFGHDTVGQFEKQSLYQFMSNDSIVYNFTLYYSDQHPVMLIKFFDSPTLTDNPFKKMKLHKLTPVPKQGQNNR